MFFKIHKKTAFIWTQFFYFIILSPSLNISKCKCGGSEISKLAVSPTVPIVWFFVTLSPTFTKSAACKFAYKLSYPSSWEIITVTPYLGSVLISFTVPSSELTTALVLSALISIPKCVVHSSKVFE